MEVKLRGGFAGLPREAVDRRKREKLRAAAESYLALHDLGTPPPGSTWQRSTPMETTGRCGWNI